MPKNTTQCPLPGLKPGTDCSHFKECLKFGEMNRPKLGEVSYLAISLAFSTACFLFTSIYYFFYCVTAKTICCLQGVSQAQGFQISSVTLFGSMSIDHRKQSIMENFCDRISCLIWTQIEENRNDMKMKHYTMHIMKGYVYLVA